MKLLRPALLVTLFGLIMIYAISCKKPDNEFGVADTFNVDSIIVTPSGNIDQAFEISWAVTTTGYPAYFLKIFLSNDSNLDTLNDVKITDTGSADISKDLNVPDETQFYYIQPVSGNSAQAIIFHNETTPDPNASGWQQSKSFANPAGTSKFIIAYFYNAAGLQIQYKRRLLAVPVAFK